MGVIKGVLKEELKNSLSMKSGFLFLLSCRLDHNHKNRRDKNEIDSSGRIRPS